MSTAIPLLPLNDGHHLPALGFGTYPLDDAAAEVAVRQALETGYRLVDTASRYGNETGVGRGIAASGVPRSEVFLATKLRGYDQGYDATLRAFDASVRRLGVDYVDLYLIHWPLPMKHLFVDTWRAFIRLRDEGRVRSIGVSNFQPAHLETLLSATGVTPAVNQVELHPDFSQSVVRAFDAQHGILTQAWSPLGRGALLANPVLAEIAARHGRTPAQVMLRWEVQLGVVPIPKTSHRERMAANLAVFDFVLDDADMQAIAALDGDNRLGGDPDVYLEE